MNMMRNMILIRMKSILNFRARLVKIFLLSLLFTFPSLLKGQEIILPKNYVCYRTNEPLSIDGKATERCWQKAQWTDDFADIEGGKKAIPRFRTRAKMLWDNDYLYVFAELSEPHIWANLKQHDTVIFYDNDFEVFIDPDGDTHKYYEYEMNALNTQWDLMLTKPYRDGGNPLTSWNFDNVRSAVKISGTLNNPSDADTCWSVEIAFPLKSFADSSVVLPLKPGAQWRINFSRVEWQTIVESGRYVKVLNLQTGKPMPEDNWVWSPQGVINMHCPETWGFVQFSGLVAGKGKEPFRPNPEERVKDELRKLYFAQRKYYSLYKRFATNPTEINLMDNNLQELKFNPQFLTPDTGYEITAKLMHSQKIWHINETGRVWPSQ